MSSLCTIKIPYHRPYLNGMNPKLFFFRPMIILYSGFINPGCIYNLVNHC